MSTKSKDSMSDAYDETQEVIDLCNYTIRNLENSKVYLNGSVSDRALKRVKDILEREIDYQVSQFN